MWCLPELLLAPERQPIKVFCLSVNIGKVTKRTRLHDTSTLWQIEELYKRQFPPLSCDRETEEGKRDAEDVAALIDHYEGTVVLSRLGLITHAVYALWRRQTSFFTPADRVYALMGLLRQRLEVIRAEKEFQAFARLSLANDTDRILERLICLLSTHRHGLWSSWADAWGGVKLWDIEPHTQVAAICTSSDPSADDPEENEWTVVLDGAWGATIHWDGLRPVGFVKRPTALRSLLKYAIRLSPLYCLAAIISIASAPKQRTITVTNQSTGQVVTERTALSANEAVAIVLFLITWLIAFTAPFALLKLYRGKFWGVQGWLFGVEGYVDLGEVEKLLFGYNHHRLKWSTNGSTLSRHKAGGLGGNECVAEEPDPSKWAAMEFDGERAARLAPQQPQHPQNATERLFTIINADSMEATMVWAEVPPTAAFICGKEGGMQRAILCSFDWKSNTFIRETVVRMRTATIDKMFRVNRFPFALKTQQAAVVAEG